MRCINQAVADKIYTHQYAIADCEQSYIVLAERNFTAPVRISVKTPQQTALLMPSSIENGEDTDIAIKIISVVPGNKARGLPLIPGKVLFYDDKTGALKALIDGFAVTRLRTGAIAGATSKILHPAPVENVVVFGRGVQGKAGLESILYVHPEVKNITIFSTSKENSLIFVKSYEALKDGRKYTVGEDVEKAVRSADILHLATTASTPLFKSEWVKEGAHISAIGAYTVEMREVPSELWGRPNVRVFIDDLDAICEEAGDVVHGIENGFIKKDDLIPFGFVINKKVEGRQNDKQITIMKSVGHAVQDNVAAKTIFELAVKQNEGVEVDI